MPDKRGPRTHAGYRTPPPGKSLSKHQRDVLRIAYGECRLQNPGKDPGKKSKCARIAWYAAKRS